MPRLDALFVLPSGLPQRTWVYRSRPPRLLTSPLAALPMVSLGSVDGYIRLDFNRATSGTFGVLFRVSGQSVKQMWATGSLWIWAEVMWAGDLPDVSWSHDTKIRWNKQHTRLVPACSRHPTLSSPASLHQSGLSGGSDAGKTFGPACCHCVLPVFT
ncbi:hypothetical protein LY76DRAFT_268042 [Colletotrichum caudatum]|nr:hypothetical protein LY76DRAFT_268042 [Colletotrichum caudatum]